MKTITITSDEKGTIVLSDSVLGVEGEHNSTQLQLVIPETVRNEVDFFRIWTDGQFSDKLTPNESTGVMTYSVPQFILKPPSVRLQIVGYKSDENILKLVWRSNVFRMQVTVSVDKVEFVPPAAYDPLAETMLQCSDTIKLMNQKLLSLDQQSSVLNAKVDLARTYSNNAKTEADRAAVSKASAAVSEQNCSTIKSECETIQQNCIDYGISKVTTADGIKNNTVDGAVATSNAVLELNNDTKDEIYSELIADVSLDDTDLVFKTGDKAATSPNTAVSTVSLANFAKKSEVPTKTSDLQNDSDFAKISDIIVDDGITENGQNAVTGKSVYSELQKKADKAVTEKATADRFKIICDVTDYSYLNYLMLDAPDTLTKGDVYCTLNAYSDGTNNYPATCYIWTGTVWKKLDVYEKLKDMATVDQTFDSASTKSQSGKAIYDYLTGDDYAESFKYSVRSVCQDNSIEKNNPFPVTSGVIYTALLNKQNVPNRVTVSGETLTVSDNAEYYGENITALTVTYPTGNFDCWLKLQFAETGTITVTLPTSRYIGEAPQFKNGETWEISIKDGVVVAQKLVDDNE